MGGVVAMEDLSDTVMELDRIAPSGGVAGVIFEWELMEITMESHLLTCSRVGTLGHRLSVVIFAEDKLGKNIMLGLHL